VDPAWPLVVARLAPDGADATATGPVVDVLGEKARSETRRQGDGRAVRRPVPQPQQQ
jgi:hypothetical protein